MLSKASRVIFRLRNVNARLLSTEVDEYFVFPREREGNIYDVNYSLNEDGITPVGDAFRNARIPIITTRLGMKSNSGKIDLPTPLYFSKYELLEAGDNLDHSKFEKMQSAINDHLSSGIDLFIEDAGLCAFYKARVGVRVVSESPAIAAIFRPLMIPIPPRPVDHRARFNGWNFDKRWKLQDFIWTGAEYHEENYSNKALKGHRPIAAFIGGPDSKLAVQFAETEGKIVGASIVAGDSTPIRGIIDAIGHATCVLMNEDQVEGIALPSVALNNGTLIVGADDEVVEAALNAKKLYGAYHNYIVPGFGVSALWNGCITQADTITSSVPVIAVNGKGVMPLSPNNLSNITQIKFYDKEAKKISSEEAIARLVALTEESKTEVIQALVKECAVSTVTNVKDAIA